MLMGDLNLNFVTKENTPALLLNMESDCEEPRVVKVEEAEVHDVEEGEISDSASINESASPVWTMRDLCKYQISSKTSYSGLYNLAWAQAVNNKPLGGAFMMINDKSNSDKDYSNSMASENKVLVNVEDNGEKEEGELEEGEIDSDSESVVENKEFDLKVKKEVAGQEIVRESIDSIMEELGNLNAADSQSYDALCLRLEKTVIKLQKMLLEGPFVEKDILVQQLLAAIQTLYSVFSSSTLRLKEQKKAVLSRLLAHVTSLKPSPFSSSQLKKVHSIRLSLESSSRNDGATVRKQAGKGFKMTDLHVLQENADNKSVLKSGNQAEQSFSVKFSEPGLVNLRPKGLALPLLDLHKDHDADSLPSPTADRSATFPFGEEFILAHGLRKPEWPVPRQNPVVHPYETAAVKAVSSYQQKFGRGSFFVSDNLPSPTPSEEGGNNRDGELSGEISSYPAVNSSISGQPTPPSATSMSASTTGSEISNVRIVEPANSFRTPMLKFPAAKVRDPRLRLANSDAVPRNFNQSVPSTGGDESRLMSVDTSSRKQKIVDELVLDGPAPKRQKNALSVSDAISTSQVTIPTLSVPVRNCTKSPLTNQNGNFPVKSSSVSSPLHSLLRDIVGNASMWTSMLKMEHQKSSGDNNSATQMPNSNSILVSAEEPRKVRMKPRDPRLNLHHNAPQKSVAAVPDQPITNASSCSVTMNDVSAHGQDHLVEKVVPSSSVKPPDITMQFTNNLNNIADIMSVSQACKPSSMLPHSVSSQPLLSHQAEAETKIVASESDSFRSGSNLTSEATTCLPPRPLNASAWSDVEHLFDGFDDKQKAAIKRERSRRLEEQNKMFAAGKLCLVLDLDHTLLNSAKFVEVDPQHDGILRKKEEQNREKPQRHLFRLPHMGMWTKLRPGIWNFLEKASKLYELHIYTMGNKCYATEMAKLLDPKGELFAGRVISRGDDGEPYDGDDRIPKSKDFERVLGMESAAVIIDDSVRVWPHNKLNLIVVERYTYFPCSRRQFGLPGPSLLEIDHDERPEDGTLASCLSVIKRIHKKFFKHHSLMEADVRNILASEQHKILAGCRIVFSRVIPIGESNPHVHPLWRTAEQFGAVCTNQIDEDVTHVVANSLGTGKVNWALSTGRFVVNPGWVEASALLYRRANEQDFAIKRH